VDGNEIWELMRMRLLKVKSENNPEKPLEKRDKKISKNNS
jgi:hypothetical protein